MGLTEGYVVETKNRPLGAVKLKLLCDNPLY